MSDATDSEATLAPLACWWALHSHLHIWRKTWIQHYSLSSKYTQLPETTLPLILLPSMSGATEIELCWQAVHSHLHAWRNTWTQHYSLLSNYTQLPESTLSPVLLLSMSGVNRQFETTLAPLACWQALLSPEQNQLHTTPWNHPPNSLVTLHCCLIHDFCCCCCLMSPWGEQT